MNTTHRGSQWLVNMRGVFAVAGLALATVVMSGCATSRNVESEVRSFSGRTPIPSGASYRFERLPSQTPESTEPLEKAAQKVLSAKGFVRTDAQASYSVQLRMEAGVMVPDALQNWANSPFPDRVVVAPDGSVWRQVRRPLLDPTWYRHSLQVVVREIAGGSVAYETRAVNESPWSDTPNLITPLMEAALGDFPQSQSAPKAIAIELPNTPASQP
jgi:hypothetical protein